MVSKSKRGKGPGAAKRLGGSMDSDVAHLTRNDIVAAFEQTSPFASTPAAALANAGEAARGSRLALCPPPVDSRPRVRILDTRSGAMVSEYTEPPAQPSEQGNAASGVRFTAVSWAMIPQKVAASGWSAAASAEAPVSKRKRTSTAPSDSAAGATSAAVSGTSELVPVVVLGTSVGNVRLYSPAQNKFVLDVPAAFSAPVCGVYVTPINPFSGEIAQPVLWACSEAGEMAAINLITGKELARWSSQMRSASAMTIISSQPLRVPTTKAERKAMSNVAVRVVVAAFSVEVWDVPSLKMVHTLTGHSNQIRSIIASASTDSVAKVVTIADTDRFAHVWAIPLSGAASAPSSTGVAQILATESTSIISIAVGSESGDVAAVGDDGIMSVWPKILATNGTGTAKPSKTIAYKATGVESTSSKKNADSRISVLLAHVLPSKQSDQVSILTARGSTLKPAIEVVELSTKDGSASDIVLERTAQSSLLVDVDAIAAANLRSRTKKIQDGDAHVVGATDMALPTGTIDDINDIANDVAKVANAESANSRSVNGSGGSGVVAEEPSLEDRVKHLSVDGSAPSASTGAAPKTGSIQTVLTQALRTNDTNLLSQLILGTKHKTSTINSTVSRIPANFVVPFLRHLVSRFFANPGRAIRLIPWLRSVLVIHAAYLMSVPELVDQLSALYTVIDERVQLYPRMAKLSGRLDMVNEQILAKIGGRQGMLAALARDSASAPSAGKRSVAEPAAVFTEDDNGTLSRVAKKSTKASRKPARDLDSDDDDDEDDDEASDMDISDADMDEDSDDKDEDSDEDVAEFSSGSDDSDVDSDDGSDLDLSEDDDSDELESDDGSE